MKRLSGFYWHVHHDILVEWCWNYQERVEYIKNHKPENERETRLRLFQPVKGKLPIEFVKAWEACIKARKAYVKARKAYDKTWEAYVKAREAKGKAWEAYVKAREAYVKAEEPKDKAWEAYVKAREAYDKAWYFHRQEIESLHAKECPNCIWNGIQLEGIG